MSMADEIVSKTKELAFKPDDLSDPFTNHGGGGHQTVEAAQMGNGKDLQESYRSGFGESAKYTEKVTGR